MNRSVFIVATALTVASLISVAVIASVRAGNIPAAFEAEQANPAGQISSNADQDASGSAYLEFLPADPQCALVNVVANNHDVSVSAPGLNAEVVVNFRNPFLYGNVESIAAGSGQTVSTIYPHGFEDKQYEMSVVINQTSGRTICPPRSINVTRPDTIKDIAQVNPQPFHPRIESATTLDDITTVLNDFMAEFSRIGQEIGAPAAVQTKVSTSNPIASLSRPRVDFQDTAADRLRYKKLAHAFIDGMARQPVRLQNSTVLNEIFFTSSIDSARAIVTGTSNLSTAQITLYIAYQDVEQHWKYNQLAATVAHEVGHVFDNRYNLVAYQPPNQPPVDTAFIDSLTANNPGGSSFVYGDWQSRYKNLPQVVYDGISYPEGFVSASSIFSLKEEIGISYGAILSDDEANLDIYDYDKRISNFDKIYDRAHSADQKLLNKLELFEAEMRKHEPLLSLEAALDINYMDNCYYECMDIDGRVMGYAGLCLDTSTATASNSDSLAVNTCNGSSQQSWRLEGNALRDNSNACLQPEGGSAIRSTAMRIRSCDGSAVQQWTQTAAGELKNLSNDLCLTGRDLFGQPTNQSGSVFVTQDICDAKSGQVWVLN